MLVELIQRNEQRPSTNLVRQGIHSEIVEGGRTSVYVFVVFMY